MSLADALVAPVAAHTSCPVADLIASLPERDADALRAAMLPGARKTKSLRLILRAEGYILSDDLIDAHRAYLASLSGVKRASPPCSCR